MKNFGNLLWGALLVLIGIIVGLNSFGITDINIFFNGWWTFIIIIPCFIGIFREEEKTGNLIGLLIGLALFSAVNDFIDFDLLWKLLFPTVLVIIGLSIIFKDMFKSSIKKEVKKLNKGNRDKYEYCSTFSSQDIVFNDEEFNGADLTSIFGGIKCDLRQANIKEDCVINTNCIFGGTDILVPDDVRVKIKSTSIFGGVSNKKKDTKDKNLKTIYVNASCIFGGVDIK